MLILLGTCARSLSTLSLAAALISTPNAWSQTVPSQMGPATPVAKASSPGNNGSYRLVIEFGSLCCGPDFGAMERLSELVAKYEKQIAKPIDRRMLNAGMEGETTFCFQLSELSAATQVDFVSDYRAASNSRRVKIGENVECYGFPIPRVER